ncbi:hypothetical protein [uncultured Hyphomonas sp.]|uniref:hypothetical protein n=1 Tax=uncultured Hyphomonas sp. TaxID=225298 RepID=UPI000C5824F3|nr:hypothetical protein [Hyphomonadaceae bacterium]MBA30130.1 hypothetical protein [Hyphomonadaceae bacterium]
MRMEKQNIFIADDGERFTDEADCIAHEKKTIEDKKRLEGLKVYTVAHSFDATEGRGYYGRTHILTDQELSIVIAYCIDRWGDILQPWYGTGYYEAWKLHSSSRGVEAALKDEGAKDRWPHKPVDIVFLSNKSLDVDRIPANVFPWPRKKTS